MKAIASAISVCLIVTSAVVTDAMAQPATASKPAPVALASHAPSLSARMDRLAKFYADNGQFMGAVLVAQRP